MSHFLDHLKNRVLLCDGGMGALIQALNLSVQTDFQGLENCTEILVESRPDIIRDIHKRYFMAGADIVETNSFGGSPITLAEFGIGERAFELNKKAGFLAREAAEEFKDSRTRFVLGAIGPGTKLPSLGHIDYDSLLAAYQIQAAGLAAGGVDGFLIETCQDPLQIKAAVQACKLAASLPILVQVTVETTGTMLVGSDITAAATILKSLNIDAIGLNCATGPQQMLDTVKWLVGNWPGLITIQPNAGLPELIDGATKYPLSPEELALWHERFVAMGINMVGGCCGTTPEHIEAVNEMLVKRAQGLGQLRPTPVKREFHWIPGVASLYSAVSFRQENSFFSIGERCNANGSKKFREFQERGEWDSIVDMAREQVKEGSNSLDVCTAFVGRDEAVDMTEVITRLRGAVDVPLVIDSTELPVIETALKLYGGKAIINSINFEDGEKPSIARLALAKQYGAAVIALTIDEVGMAKTPDDKIRIAKRLYDFAVGQHGLEAADLLFDPLTFTICTGVEEDRKLALYTLEAIERLAKELPECGIVLGLSNVSFGLKPAARQVLNSVFIYHALQRGMNGAIVHVSKIAPLHQIPEEEVKIAEDLIFDRRRPDYDPLQAFIALFEDREITSVKKELPLLVEDRLKQRIIDGAKTGLEQDLEEALKTYKPLDIINQLLLEGMKIVGELFGSGKMQLPFVLQSAETMKAAVGYLEPFMEKISGSEKGTIVLATVKGDVHDIGKNLVDIILTNNGYKVVNLGIKQPIAEIIKAALEYKADAVGMSGLLVKSTVIMRENLEEMTRLNLQLPVLLGGAALTRKYVEEDCVKAYGSGLVAYAKDAFAGLDLMGHVSAGTFQTLVDQRNEAPKSGNRKRIGQPMPVETSHERRPIDFEALELRRSQLHANNVVPKPPFWGAKIIEKVPLRNLIPYLNEVMLYQFHWGYRKQGRSINEFKQWASKELRPIALAMLKKCESESILNPVAVYGYWQAASDGDQVVIFDHDGMTPLARFAFPRQNRPDGLSIADFYRPISDPIRDVIGLQIVTVGHKASDVAREWFAEDKYQDYLYLHGLSVEITEAMAEYVHKRIRTELGFVSEEALEMDKLLKQSYRGSRFSFGYPACPHLEDQTILLKLLGAERIGISLTEEFELEPEQSTSAIVTIHPQAKYFSV